MRIGDFEVRRLSGDTCAVVQYKGEGKEITIPPSFGRYVPAELCGTLLRKGCKAERITIPPSVETIDESLFPSLRCLSSFEVQKGSKSFRSEDGVLYDSSCYSLLFYPPAKECEAFIPPKKLGRVARTAFCCKAHFRTFTYSSKLEEFQALPSECPELEAFVPAEDAADHEGVLIKGRKLLFYPPGMEGRSYSIPEGIEEIAALPSEPFFPEKVRTVYAPASLKKGLENALGNAERAEVDGKSGTYRSVDGVLYSWKRVLLAYPGRRSDEVYVTPSGTDRIGDGAFRRSQLRTLVISQGVTAIGNSAFEDSSITTLVIPPTVTDIGVHALYGAKNLKTVIAEKGSVAEIFLRGEGRSDMLHVLPSLF